MTPSEIYFQDLAEAAESRMPNYDQINAMQKYVAHCMRVLDMANVKRQKALDTFDGSNQVYWQGAQEALDRSIK